MPPLIRENISLADMTTFRIGGNARYFSEVTSEVLLLQAIDFAKRNKLPVFVLGGGSNILVSDGGFKGLVIKMAIKSSGGSAAMTGGLSRKNMSNDQVKVTVASGEDWDAFVGQCVSEGLYGLENLSGIPGTVGAAPVQNIGAYGSEVKDCILSVRAYDTSTGNFVELMKSECLFSYRDSIFKKQSGRYIVTSVTFVLKKTAIASADYKDIKEYFKNREEVQEDAGAAAAPITPAEMREAILAIRACKLPDVRIVGTAGSFFKNPIISKKQYTELTQKYPDMPSYPISHDELAFPDIQKPDDFVKVPLGWVIDHVLGYKGKAEGNVGTYENQALVLVNRGHATALEIKKFADAIATDVKQKTGITIEPEVQYVG